MTRRKFIQKLKCVFESSQENLIRYLIQEVKFLLDHLGKRPKPTQTDKALLVRAAKAVDPVFLEKTFNLFTPNTLYRWYRELVCKKWDYSHLVKKKVGRPKIDKQLEDLIVKLAIENPNDGYQALVGRLKILGIETNGETVQNVLKRNGINPAPSRNKCLSWKEFLETHWDSLTATDFLSWEVLTPFGLISYYVLFFIRLKDRKVHIAGITTHPDGLWMSQMARNLTDPQSGFLCNNNFLLHDRDSKYSSHFTRILNEAGVKTQKLPAKSPNLNAYAERFVKTVKEQCLSRLIITSEEQLRKTLKEYVQFYNYERAHQGLDNTIPSPRPEDNIGSENGEIRKKQHLGGLLNFYFRSKNEVNPMPHHAKVVA